MATTHHHHISSDYDTDRSGGVGMLLGILMLILFMFLLFYYGLPAIKGAKQAPQINVTGQIDVNIKQ